MEALAANKPKTAPYDTEAQVVRVEGSTAWVHIPGGVDETPVAMTINASAGDTVRVRVGNGTAWLVGNDTAPPTDDGTAIIANRNAGMAQQSADAAYSFAATAHGIAKKTDKHFFVDTDGAHVTVGENTPNQGKNLLMTNEGIMIRNNTTELATFTASGAVIGEEDKSHVAITPEITTFYNVDGETPVGIISNANLATHAREQRIFYFDNPEGTVFDDIDSTSTTETLSAAPYNLGGGYHLLDITLQVQAIEYDPETLEGEYVDQYSETITFSTYATQTASTFPLTLIYAKVSSSYRVTMTFGDLSALEMQSPRVIITAYYYDGAPSSKYSFGIGSTAAGDYSFAEGYNTRAAGAYSFAGGMGTIANGNLQAVFGRYNAQNTSDWFQIGNGSSASARSNIFRILSSGVVNTNRGNLTAFKDVFGPPASEFALAKNINLNSIVTPGCYYCVAGTTAATQTNQPFNNSSYQMLVFAYAGNQRFQVAWQNAVNTTIRYRIRTDQNVWGEWKVLAMGNVAHPVGDIVWAYKSSSGTTSVPVFDVNDQSGTVVNMASISLTAGNWIITAHASFQAAGATIEAMGYRGVRIGSNAYNDNWGGAQVPASPRGNTVIEHTRHVQISSTQSFYLNIYSNTACVANNSQVIEATRVK